MVNHDLDLEKEDNVEIYGSRNKEKCCNVKVSANNSSITTTKENILENTTDTPISLATNAPLKTSSSRLCIRDLENSKDSQADFVHKKKPVEESNLHLRQQLFLSQKEHIACLEDTISHLRGELDCKQKVIDNLLDMLKSCLHSKLTRHDEKYFALQNQTPILIQKMLIKVTLQSTLIKKQLISIQKPSTTIKNKIKNVLLFLTSKIIKDTLMTSLKRQYQIQLIMPNHREMIMEILKQQGRMELKTIMIKKKVSEFIFWEIT